MVKVLIPNPTHTLQPFGGQVHHWNPLDYRLQVTPFTMPFPHSSAFHPQSSLPFMASLDSLPTSGTAVPLIEVFACP